MNRSIRFIVMTLALLAVTAFAVYGAQLRQPIFIGFSNTARIDTMWLGVGNLNTYGQDLTSVFGPYGQYREAMSPPAPPSPFDFFARWIDIPGRSGLGTMRPWDYRGFVSSAQVDSYLVRVIGDDFESINGTTMTICWQSNLLDNGTAWKMKKWSGSGSVYDDFVNDMTAMTCTTLAVASNDVRLLIIKTGALEVVDGPVFSTVPASPTFGTVAVTGGTQDLTVQIRNAGAVNNLIVTGISDPDDEFDIVTMPTLPLTILPGAQVPIVVRFDPEGDGARTGNIVFTHNDPTYSPSPTTMVCNGVGISQGGELAFVLPPVQDNSVTDDGYYEGKIVLNNYAGANLKAVQFTLTTTTRINIHPLVKAGTFASANWVLNVNVVSRTPNPDGSSTDVINVLLYGNGTTSQGPISAPIDVLTFGFDVVNILGQSETVTMGLSAILGSTSVLSDAGLNKPSQAATGTIVISNRTKWGDVNEDDAVDIIDLLMVADHISGRRLLTVDQQTLADVSPWAVGDPAPAGDDVINVFDLVQLQMIIMDGEYPTVPPTPIQKVAADVVANSLSKGATQFNIYYADGLLAMEVIGEARACQLDILGIKEASDGEFTLKNTTWKRDNDRLRILAYDAGLTAIPNGIFLQMPVKIDPSAIRVEGFVVADENNNRVTNATYKLIQGTPSNLPMSYSLDQNFPNPFNPDTKITFAVPELSDVRISIYNVLGQEVRTLFAGQMERGTQTVNWDGKDATGKALASGTYIYRMTAGTFVETKKMMLLK